MKMNKWMYLLIGVLAVLLALSAVKDNMIKFSVEKVVQGVTGLKLSISGMEVGIFSGIIDIKGLKLHNPRGFKDRLMLDMPEIYVHYDLPAFFRGKIHFKDMKINMKEFIVEKNSRAQLNLDSLKVVSDSGAEKAKPEEGKKGPGMRLQIDTLELKVGKVIYKDYSQGGAPSVNEFDVDINEKYENITDLQSLVSLILMKSLAKTTISKLADFELDRLTSGISDNLLSQVSGKLFGSSGAGKMLGEAVEKMMGQ
ncbi:MAG: hypothetical protein U9R44_06465 [Candidatus Omnitrophota bacterium]|nr:hypothetical protein [Candidatus Omnitrophota bacterium]